MKRHSKIRLISRRQRRIQLCRCLRQRTFRRRSGSACLLFEARYRDICSNLERSTSERTRGIVPTTMLGLVLGIVAVSVLVAAATVGNCCVPAFRLPRSRATGEPVPR